MPSKLRELVEARRFAHERASGCYCSDGRSCRPCMNALDADSALIEFVASTPALLDAWEALVALGAVRRKRATANGAEFAATGPEMQRLQTELFALADRLAAENAP